ncbi:MAG: AAA domain-containing protein, partial [Anaerolineales bacterium]|nr:AAA domain-containing protein [Anaerolineales bacterium]
RYEDAVVLQDQAIDLQEQLEALRGLDAGDDVVVGAEDIAELVSMWTGIPITQVSTNETDRLLRLEDALHKRIVGQDEAITALAKAVRRARAGLKDPRRPIGSFIFLGPTGVGKTELSKALAEFMFGNEDALVQLDMSEFMERHTVARLVGAPPGYVGYEEAGQLTEAIRRRPFSIIVFDEIEKAHPEAFNMLLQIMEEGHLADARGHKVDFRNTILIMTSNIGAELIKRQASIGFTCQVDEGCEAESEYERMRSDLLDQLKRAFRPEFLNRVDNVIVFHALTREHIGQIVELELDKVQQRLAEYTVALEATDEAKRLIADEGYSEEYGARPLRRVIQQRVEDPLSDGLLSRAFELGDTVVVDAEEGAIVLRTAEAEPEMEPEAA